MQHFPSKFYHEVTYLSTWLLLIKHTLGLIFHQNVLRENQSVSKYLERQNNMVINIYGLRKQKLNVDPVFQSFVTTYCLGFLIIKRKIMITPII